MNVVGSVRYVLIGVGRFEQKIAAYVKHAFVSNLEFDGAKRTLTIHVLRAAFWPAFLRMILIDSSSDGVHNSTTIDTTVVRALLLMCIRL